MSVWWMCREINARAEGKGRPKRSVFCAQASCRSDTKDRTGTTRILDNHHEKGEKTYQLHHENRNPRQRRMLENDAGEEEEKQKQKQRQKKRRRNDAGVAVVPARAF